MEGFEKWKTSYVHSYRKAHRAYYQKLKELESEPRRAETQGPGAGEDEHDCGAWTATPHNGRVATDLAAVEKRLYVCPDAEEAAVDGAEPSVPSAHGRRAISRLSPRLQN